MIRADSDGLPGGRHRAALYLRDAVAGRPRRPPDQREPGDLVFFNSGAQDAVLLKHVGIYLDKSLMIDALHAGVVIRTEPIATWHLPRCPAPSVPVL